MRKIAPGTSIRVGNGAARFCPRRKTEPRAVAPRTKLRARGTRVPVPSQPAQRHFLDLVAFALAQNESRALASGQDVLVQIDEVDARPDRRRSLDRFLVR